VPVESDKEYGFEDQNKDIPAVEILTKQTSKIGAVQGIAER